MVAARLPLNVNVDAGSSLPAPRPPPNFNVVKKCFNMLCQHIAYHRRSCGVPARRNIEIGGVGGGRGSGGAGGVGSGSLGSKILPSVYRPFKSC